MELNGGRATWGGGHREFTDRDSIHRLSSIRQQLTLTVAVTVVAWVYCQGMKIGNFPAIAQAELF
jgi:hypothetical protein